MIELNGPPRDRYMLKFEPEFSSDLGTGCLLWADEPTYLALRAERHSLDRHRRSGNVAWCL
jgi:hypothetical protein